MSKHIFPTYRILRSQSCLCLHDFTTTLTKLLLLCDNGEVTSYVHYGRWENL